MGSRILIFSQRGREAFRVPLPSRGRLTIGRGPECSVSLPDDARLLSRVHCEIRVRPSGVFVVDQSSNGTRLGSERLRRDEPRLLRVGTSMRLPGWDVAVESPSGVDGSTVDRRSDSHAPTGAPGHFHGMRADTEVMRALFGHIERVAGFAIPVLIHGETGTGKELVARAVHDASPRANKQFVTVNCGAIHGETAHSRLFGHEKGAFTGATAAAPGAFREAHGGTLFLDEIGELSLRQQTALLRVLERREVVPLGASRPIPVNYRLVAATHRDLRKDVGRGRFREDLYYRLDVAVLRVPPLRHRPGDIPLLARHFLAELAPGAPPRLDADGVERLLAHSWPGNVRELRNTILRALLATDGPRIAPDDLAIREALRPGHTGLFAAEPTPGQELPAPTWEPGDGASREKAQILSALERASGSRKEAARLLGVARSTLYVRMRRLGLS